MKINRWLEEQLKAIVLTILTNLFKWLRVLTGC